ncbi:hypothetical protein Tco_0775080 [Tanacetum coccineum]
MILRPDYYYRVYKHNDAFKSELRGRWPESNRAIKYFLKIVDPIDLPNVNQDKLRVVVFPISLAGDAWRWYSEWPTCSWKEDGYCNGGNLPGAYIDGYEIADHDQEGREYENGHEDMERCELFDDHELPVCYIRRFKMIKYSFGDDEEYVAVKEDEYDDLTSANKDACRAYQEIFRMMGRGYWMVQKIGVGEAEEKSNLKTLL